MNSDEYCAFYKKNREEYSQREADAKKKCEELGLEFKVGLYKYGEDVIDCYQVPKQGWFWGFGSDCGNRFNYQMLLECEYIGEATKEYADATYGMMMVMFGDNDVL